MRWHDSRLNLCLNPSRIASKPTYFSTDPKQIDFSDVYLSEKRLGDGSTELHRGKRGALSPSEPR